MTCCDNYDVDQGFGCVPTESHSAGCVKEDPDIRADREADTDAHGNSVAEEGVTRCSCGAKYWEHDRCVSCRLPVWQGAEAFAADAVERNLA